MDRIRGRAAGAVASMTGMAISGKTRFVLMLGDPIVQVKAPAGFAAWARDTGTDAVMLPVAVPEAALPATLEALRGWRNCLGAVVTCPHKQAVARLVDSVSPAVGLTGACNVVRRTADGQLHGEMTDGLGFVAALRANGFDPAGRDVQLVGAGGAGAAIALALAESGARLVITDRDRARQTALLDRLAAQGQVLSARPEDFSAALVCNATPVGMNGDTAHPWPLEDLPRDCFVADIVPEPAETPWIVAARARGHRVQTGPEMVAGQMPAIVDILMAHRDGAEG